MSVPPHRFERVDELTDPACLSRLLGPITGIEATPLTTVGFTGARHHRIRVEQANGVERRLVIKDVDVARDWIARRSGDRTGREASMLAEPQLADVWTIFARPHLAFAIEEDRIGLLMDDLGPFLFPDVRAPLADHEEQALLATLATLHARFWDDSAARLPWLARPIHFATLLGPSLAQDPAATIEIPTAFGERVTRGWSIALSTLPSRIARTLTLPPAELVARWGSGPATLLHGDAKVANFAILPNRRVAAFDWAMVGSGPAAIDLGWHLSVNATRLSVDKETSLDRYREELRRARGVDLGDAEWIELRSSAVVFGALMGLWSKALALESGAPAGQREWSWWVEHLASI